MHDKCSGGKGKKSMDNVKIGNLINKLRKEKGMTQLQLAERLHISDKTVSKWERGQGCPDVSLLTDLSRVFGVDLEKLLSGQLDTNEETGGNMKKLNFYVCPECGNVFVHDRFHRGCPECGNMLTTLVEGKELAIESIEVDIPDEDEE